jgi:hypothetical protein
LYHAAPNHWNIVGNLDGDFISTYFTRITIGISINTDIRVSDDSASG